MTDSKADVGGPDPVGGALAWPVFSSSRFQEFLEQGGGSVGGGLSSLTASNPIMTQPPITGNPPQEEPAPAASSDDAGSEDVTSDGTTIRPASVARAGHGGGLARRRLFLVVAMIVCVVLGVASGFMLARIKSPADAALAQSPPPLSVLTSTVTREVVRSTVLGHGVVQVAAPVDVDVPPVGSGRQVLSHIGFPDGSSVQAGQVLGEVSGRPIILLTGSVTPYRDLSYGDAGTDVVQLQTALQGIGYRAPSSGKIDSGTCAVVRELYADRHYSLPADTSGSSDGSVAGGSGASASTPVVPSSCQGLTIPLGEFWFVPQFPVTVVSWQAAQGGELDATEPLAVLSDGQLDIQMQLDPSLAANVKTGLAAQAETGSGTATGKVADISVSSSVSGAQQATVVIVPDEALSADMLGASLAVTIIEAETDQPVLAVPISAIYTSSDATVFVLKLDAQGSQTKVVVTPGVVGDDAVQVTPVDAGSLSVGDDVVTGP